MDKQKIRITPKDVFLHLFNILIFYLMVIGFITLYVQYINVLFPDQLNYYFTGLANIIRVSSSLIIIAAPVYVLTAWMLSKDIKKNPAKQDQGLRKWLIYFTLFISAITIIVDLIMFVYNFLSGGLSIQFSLKVAVVLLVAVAVFGYYLWELKRKDLNSKLPKILGWSVIALALISVIIGFFVIGTPAEQRSRELDDLRVQDLQNLQYQIINYWQQKDELPTQLSQLNDDIMGFKVPVDPQTEQQEKQYDYRVTGDLSFELCAEFETETDKYQPQNMKPRSMYEPYGENWSHKAEKTCFERTIDPELYAKDRAGLKPMLVE